MRRSPVLLLVFTAFGCPIPEPRTCETIAADFESERTEIQSCEVDTECGQVLTSTSCGCTRDLVARTDADTTTFYDLIDEANEGECDLGLASVCDCPITAGFRCDEGTCVHNYVDDYPYLPVCYADRGDSLSIDGAVIEGDDLVVTVGYGGGCESHDIVLCWPDQAFAESYPVQASLELFHDAHDDMCDAYLTEDRRLSLAPLSAAWHDAYGAGSGSITIHIGGYDLSYDFP